nr:MAG TPA: hypothetical protein [Caudoviricetes sp.]
MVRRSFHSVPSSWGKEGSPRAVVVHRALARSALSRSALSTFSSIVPRAMRWM